MHTQAHSRRRLLASAFAPTLTLPVLLLQAAEPAGAPARLPLTELILYSSGVGYFERAGQVAGRAEVELRFKTDDINDLLKSMVVQDFNGGRVGSVTYGSRDPITKTLRSFGLDLTKNPTQAELLAQVRGEKVEVRWPNPVTGTIVGVERRKQPAGEKGEVDVDYLNLLTDDGLQSIPLPQVQKLRLLSERLNTELRQALEVLASGHDTQKKTVTITFDGQGQRKVAVAYIAQTPVWKTSYRLVLDEKAQPFLQGWAIVENTSDEDWNNVTLSLVSGRPISFSMDLYQPLYTTRPVVVPELYSSLRPQVYGDAVDRPSEAAPRPAAAGRKMERALALADAAGLAAAPMAKGMASEQAAMAFNFNLADSDRGGHRGRGRSARAGVCRHGIGRCRTGGRTLPIPDQDPGHTGTAEVGHASDHSPDGRR